MRETTRNIDLAARYGGDELALILPETGPDGARILGDRLRNRTASAPVEAREEPLRFTISVGAASLPDSAESAPELLEAADQALLRAKRSGKNRTFSAPRHRDAAATRE